MNQMPSVIFNPDNLTTEIVDSKGWERITCPECPSVYYMLIGTNANSEELYRCHECKCEWKWSMGKRFVTKHGTLNEEIE